MANSKTTTMIVMVTILAVVLPRLIVAQSPAPAPMGMMAPSPGIMMAPSPGIMMAPYPGTMAPAPGLDCLPYLLNVSDCLTFVTDGSNLTKPEAGCCTELADLVNEQPLCLCQLLGDPGKTGFSVDVKRALKLPSVCNVTTPPVSLCAAIGFPVGDLAPSEAPSSGGSIASSPSPVHGDDQSSGNFLASNHHYFIGLAALLSTYFI